MAARLRWITPRRAAGAVALLLAVVAVHACVTREVARRMADFSREQALPQRLTVTYVRELQLTAPPVAAAPPAPPLPKPRPARRPTQAAPPPAAAASAPASVADATEAASAPGTGASAPEVEAVAQAAPESPQTPASAPTEQGDATAATAGASASAPAPGAEPFAWPPSTRVTYNLTGHYRGPVSGDAQVEWIKAGSRYQVHVDLSIGPRAAPLLQRRMSSEGELGGTRLMPTRYDEQTKAVLRDTRRATVMLDEEEIVLADGERKPRVDGVQDAASQFIHLAVLFAVRPELLIVGGVVETIVATPRSVDVWVYDVLAEETLHTPFGPLETFHLKPRRRSTLEEPAAEIWFAPRMRYLPARIVIRQDPDSWADLMIARRPQLGAP